MDTERYRGLVEDHWGPLIRGWVTDAESGDPVTVVIQHDGEKSTVVADDFREDILRRGQHPDGRCGFSLYVGKMLRTPAVVSVKDGTVQLKSRRPLYAGKKLFFMHIAKTGGSSLNRVIAAGSAAGECVLHFEGIEDWSALRSKRWLSGHVSLPRFLSHFAEEEYVKFVLLRRPIDQLASHLSWVRQLLEPENADFARRHPEVVRKISKRLQRIDFSSPDQMARFAAELNMFERGLFDNCQCRYFTHCSSNSFFSADDYRSAAEGLKSFEIVGITEKLEDSVKRMFELTGARRPPSFSVTENKSRYDYGFNKNDPDLIEAVEPMIRFDNRLYAMARELSVGEGKAEE